MAHKQPKHTVTKQSALDELIRQGVAQPTWQLARSSDTDEDDNDDQDMRPVLWVEPMPGRNPQDPYSGFKADWMPRKFRDHETTLFEVNESDGIEVSQVRAIFTNPYRLAIAKGVDNETSSRMLNFGMQLWVSDDPNLSNFIFLVILFFRQFYFFGNFIFLVILFFWQFYFFGNFIFLAILFFW